MNYDDVPEHLKAYFGRAAYERAPPESREFMIQGAEEAHQERSQRYEYRAERTSNPAPYGPYNPSYVNDVAGIRRIEYTLSVPSVVPDVDAFVDILTRIREDMHAINFVLMYEDQNEHIRWNSFSKKDRERIGLDNCVKGIADTRHWDGDMYHGSESTRIIHATLSRVAFAVIVPINPEGGSHRKQYVNYTTKGIDSDDNDCLIECYKHFKELPYSNNDIRKMLGVRPGKKLGLQYVPKLEEIFEINVKVVEDVVYPKIVTRKGVAKTVMTAKVLHGKGRNCILHHEDHFDVVLKRHRKVLNIPDDEEDNIEENIEPIHYYFFDYETTYNPTTLELEVYAYCLLKFDHKRKLVDKHVGASDLVDVLKEMHDDDKSYIIGFNNSRFDNFILIQDMIDSDFTINNALIANNSFLSFTSRGFISRDLCRILCTSLKSACQSFKCEMSKLDFDHATVQNERNYGRFDQYYAINKAKIYEYVEMDCQALAELFFKTKDAVEELTGFKIESHPTIGSLTYNAFKKSINQKKMPVVKDVVIDDFIRSSIIGGRTEIVPGEYDDMSSIDVTSLYPHVMMENVFPIGQPIHTDGYKEDKIGVYNVVIHSQPIPNVIPHKNEEDGTLDWQYRGEIKRVLTSVDIECLRRHGGYVTVNDGCYWKESASDLFDEYFELLKKEKKRQDEYKDAKDPRYNPALRELCKLLMNALSGKLAQRRYEHISMFIQNNKQRNAFENKVDKDSIKYYVGKNYIIAQGHKMKSTVQNPVIWGTLIYSYARTLMYDSVLSKVRVYGMDTDSAFIKNDDIDKLGDIYGDEFGKFKIETKQHHAVLVAPKCYAFFRKSDEYKIIKEYEKDGKKKVIIEHEHGVDECDKDDIDKDGNFIIKQRFKGVNAKRDKVLEGDMKEKLNVNKKSVNNNIKNCEIDVNVKEIHDYYFDKDHNHIEVNTYREMITNSLDILTSSLNKQIHTQAKLPLSLMQRFSVKHTKDVVN